MAENGRMFRTSISGYNKDDVNRYIIETDRKNREQTDELTKKTEELTKANTELTKKAETLEQNNAESADRLLALEEELNRLKEENKAQAASIEEITKRYEFCRIQTDAQNEALAKAKEERERLNRQIEALTEDSHGKDLQIKQNAEKYAADIETLRSAYEKELAQIKDAAKVDESVAYKLDMYDRISSQIGDILINANRNSDEIISAARSEAANLLTRTNTEAAENSARMKDGIRGCADQTVNELKNEFTSNIGSCVKEIQTCITDMQYETDALMAFLNRKQTEINERLEFYHGSLTENIDGKLQSMEAECRAVIEGGNAAQ